MPVGWPRDSSASQTVQDARIDCPLADPVGINGVVRTLYNLTAEQECCALLAATAPGETTYTLSHVLAAVAADDGKAVYDDETAEMAVVSMVNLSAQAKLVDAAQPEGPELGHFHRHGAQDSARP